MCRSSGSSSRKLRILSFQAYQIRIPEVCKSISVLSDFIFLIITINTLLYFYLQSVILSIEFCNLYYVLAFPSIDIILRYVYMYVLIRLYFPHTLSTIPWIR